nr:jmjc domain-containing protein 7 [Quercus suber]
MLSVSLDEEIPFSSKIMPDDPIASLLETYHDLNAAVVDELDSEPSALEFMRYVAANRPFVARKAAADWAAVRKWDAPYLKEKMAGEDVRIAATPLGNADAIVETEGQVPLFVEPWETTQPFCDFLDALLQETSDSSSTTPGLPIPNVQYAQPQNDSLRNEYPALAADVPRDIPFARIALQRRADAVNIWLGGDRSVTALHKDNYENVYVQVRGRKHFVLLPPVEMPCVNECAVARARYAPVAGDGGGDDDDDDDDDDIASSLLEVVPDVQGESVPVPMWDPDLPQRNPSKYSHLARPLRVTLSAGDVLYLPALWYHKVSQSRGEDGFVCAVNYWYDMEFAGAFWTGMNFVRDVVEKQRKTEVDYGELEMDAS